MRWRNPEAKHGHKRPSPLGGCVRNPSPEDADYRVIDVVDAHHSLGGGFSQLLKIIDSFEISEMLSECWEHQRPKRPRMQGA
jgi:hypothetical protein